ncbi:MAG: hypothetical protein ACXADB_12545 [Candidatus Hermodarchaeia archaeon]|jgi:hypothetical protein
MPTPRKFWKALKCPICGERAVFYVTMDAVKDAKQYPVPFEVIHEDHKFEIFLDSGLLISRIEEPKEVPPPAPKKKTKSKKTK